MCSSAVLAEQVRRSRRPAADATTHPCGEAGAAGGFATSLGPCTRAIAVRSAPWLTQEDLASLAGTSRATVNRVLRQEERRGTVELRRGRASVLDLEELSRRC